MSYMYETIADIKQICERENLPFGKLYCALKLKAVK